MVKRMNITLDEVESLPLDVMGDHLLKYRRKKRSHKKPLFDM